MIEFLPSFLDEIEKVSASLTKKEKRRQAIEFATMGALSGPAIGAIVNLIQGGKIAPPGISKKRWLAGSMAGGALLSGAIPFLRHAIERKYQAKASERARRRRMRAAKVT